MNTSMLNTSPDVCILQPAYSTTTIEEEMLHNTGFSCGVATIIPGQALADNIKRAKIIMVRDSSLNVHIIKQLQQCQAVIRYGVGYNNVDIDALTIRGIMLCNIPDYDTDDVSTHALALYLALRRRLISRNQDVRQGNWAIDDKEPIYTSHHTVFGLIGFGRIARRLLDKVRGFEPERILVYDPFVSDEELALAGVERASVNEICSNASMISLHVPYNNDTHHIISASQLELMRKECILINTSRGGLIDEVALNDALFKEQIFAAGLDVFAQEPVCPDSPLLQRQNLIVSDHCGWYSESAMYDLRSKATREAIRILSRQQPVSCVNRHELALKPEKLNDN